MEELENSFLKRHHLENFKGNARLFVFSFQIIMVITITTKY